MQCPRCQQNNPIADAQFCPQCGAPAKHDKQGAAAGGSYADLQRDLTEGREQQTATNEILRVISRSPTSLEPVAQAIADSAGRLCSCAYSAVFRFDGELIHWVAARGASGVQVDALRGVWPRPPGRETLVGRVVLARDTLHIRDAASDPTHAPSLPTARAALAIRSWLGVPMLREDKPIGVIVLVRVEVRPFSEQEIALVQTFASQAVIAIENARLFNETKETLEQQTATAEILRVISSSPTDLQPVFDAIARSAAVLCGSSTATVFRLEGGVVDLVAHHGGTPEWLALVRELFPADARERPVGWVALERATLHFPDIENDPRATPEFRAAARALGFRRGLLVPMLRAETPLGVIGVGHAEPGPFSDNQIALLKTFADQAAIAIENVRLFKELETRNRDLSESLEQQTATAEILRVISSSPTDVQPVFDAIVRNAGRLCEAASAALNIVEGDLQRKVAESGPESFVLRIGETRPIIRTSLTGRAMLESRTISIADISDRDTMREYPDFRYPPGTRACLATPLLREG